MWVNVKSKDKLDTSGQKTFNYEMLRNVKKNGVSQPVHINSQQQKGRRQLSRLLAKTRSQKIYSDYANRTCYCFGAASL